MTEAPQDDDPEDERQRITRRSGTPWERKRRFSQPPAMNPRYTTPGVMEAIEHHREMMHEYILALVRG